MSSGVELDLGRLETRQFGRALESFGVVSSTNDVLWDWAERGAPHGAVCVALAQQRGRGRQGRPWSSPAGGNLYMSLLLRPAAPLADMASFSLAAAVATAEALEAVTGGLPVGLKWPNDLWIEGRKVGGILLEGHDAPRPAMVLGMGINLRCPREDWDPVLRQTAISLEEAGVHLSRDAVLCRVLGGLEGAYTQFLREGLRPFLPAWSGRSVLEGRRVQAAIGHRRIEGRVLGVDPGGGLVVELVDGEREILGAGEVHLLPEGTP